MPPQSSIYGPVFPPSDEPAAPPPERPSSIYTSLPPSNIFSSPDDDARLARTVGQARTASPDTATRIWTLQRKTGLPPAVIADHLDEIEQQAAAHHFDAATFRKESPYLAAWLQEDAQQAAIANDDLAHLGLLEWLVTAPQRALTRGVAQVEFGQLRAQSLFRPLTEPEERRLAELKKAMPVGGAYGVGDSWFRGAVTGAAEQLPNMWGAIQLGTQRALPAGVTAGGLAAIGSLVFPPSELVNVPLMFGAGVTAGMRTGAAEYAFQLEAGLAYDEYLTVKDDLGHTIDPDVARVAALATGVVNAGLEVVGLEKLLHLVPGVKQVTGGLSRSAVKEALRSPTVRGALFTLAKHYAGTLTTETAVEVAQEAMTILAGEAAKAASGVTPTGGGEIAGRLSATAAQAAQSFALLSLPGPLLSAGGDVRAARQAAYNQTFFTALGEGVTQSKVAARSPAALQSFLAQATTNGPLKDLYAPVDTWTTYWQSKNLDPAQMATELTGDAEAYARAVRQGTDLVIPTATYAAKLAGTEHNTFFAQELRTAPDLPNAREAKAIRAAVEARMQAAASTAAAPGDTSPARTALLAELEARGVTPDEASRIADLHGAIIGTLGARVGQPEATLVADYPIAITTPGFAGVTAPVAAGMAASTGTTRETAETGNLTGAADTEGDILLPQGAVEEPTGPDVLQTSAKPPVAPGVAIEYAQARKGGRGGQRGYVRFAAGRGPRRFEVGLFKAADPSTPLHELGHVYLEILGDLAGTLSAQDTATLSATQQGLGADYQAFLSFLGVSSRDDLTTEHHEKFARAFEAYLFEGQAPSVELRSAFASFAAWLRRVYRSITALNVELSPAVRGLFDRLVASDEAIAAAQSEAGVTPLFTDAASAGMTDEQFATYQEQVREAHAREEETLRTRVLKDLTRADQAWWTQAKDAMTASVTAELQQEPVYRAMSALRTGAYPDGTPVVEGQDPPVPQKLSRDALVARYGTSLLGQLPRPYLYAKDATLTADAAAEAFGFSSGDELVQALVAAQPLREAVAREVDRRMTMTYGDVFLDGRLEAEAHAIVTGGEHRHLIVAAELAALTREAERTLGGRTTLTRGLERTIIPPREVINEAARTQIAATKIRDLRPGLFLQAARRASKQAYDLLAIRQDRPGAVKAKLQELINLALYREARDTQDRVESMRRTLRSYQSTAARQRFGKAGHDYLLQIDALLDRYELARVTQQALAGRVTLAAFVKAQQAADIPIEIPQTLLDETRRINYIDVPVAEFTDVYDAVEHLARLARLKNELLKASTQRTFAEARDTLVGSILLHGTARPRPLEFRPADERQEAINHWFAGHIKLATHARALDGFADGGEMWEQVIAKNPRENRATE